MPPLLNPGVSLLVTSEAAAATKSRHVIVCARTNPGTGPAEFRASERWCPCGWKVKAQTFESRGSKSVAPREICGAGIEGAMDVACVVGEKVPGVAMGNNDRAASDEDRVMVDW
jgi:hypothetical protein